VVQNVGGRSTSLKKTSDPENRSLQSNGIVGFLLDNRRIELQIDSTFDRGLLIVGFIDLPCNFNEAGSEIGAALAVADSIFQLPYPFVHRFQFGRQRMQGICRRDLRIAPLGQKREFGACVLRLSGIGEAFDFDLEDGDLVDQFPNGSGRLDTGRL
jgi:hypothetical protein